MIGAIPYSTVLDDISSDFTFTYSAECIVIEEDIFDEVPESLEGAAEALAEAMGIDKESALMIIIYSCAGCCGCLILCGLSVVIKNCMKKKEPDVIVKPKVV